MQFISSEINPLGLGCWPSAGSMYGPDGRNLGYSNSNDTETKKAFQAAVSNGITLFDTAVAYGAGHSERLLGDTIGNSPTCQIVTKIGIGIDEASKELCFENFTADQVSTEINSCLKRLKRDTIDLLLLHQNELAVTEANDFFDAMDVAVAQGKIRSYGWSTDFSDSVSAVASRPGYIATEHAMNVLLDAPAIQRVAEENALLTLIRSPLAMGLLSGKYDESSRMNPEDIRSNDEGWLQYFANAAPNPIFLNRFHAVKELLQSNGRTTTQGALGWLWAKRADNIPIPGARTVEQVEQLAAALDFGPLAQDVMLEIETLIDRTHEVDTENRAR